jgi:CRISPR-associated protein (TIGR02710 family)
MAESFNPTHRPRGNIRFEASAGTKDKKNLDFQRFQTYARVAMPIRTVLVASVGGSPEPICKAIEECQPEHVFFLCSQPIGNVSGSDSYIPEIRSKCDLRDEQFTIRRVPADDLDAVTALADRWLREIMVRYDGAQIRVVYTGGTKAMSAGLVFAASFYAPDVKLASVSGTRRDHVRITSGHGLKGDAFEFAALRQGERDAQAAWQRHAYADAVASIERARRKIDSQANFHNLSQLLEISTALAHWDAFAYGEAHERWKVLPQRFRDDFRQHGRAIASLAKLDPGESTPASAEEPTTLWPLRLYDLGLNAQRRAKEGRYDDAVSRSYRLCEGVAQWLLKTGLRIDADEFPSERALPNWGIGVGSGPLKVPLLRAWEAVVHYRAEMSLSRDKEQAIADFWQSQAGVLKHLLEVRNHSFLAHGYTPIREDDWRRWQNMLRTQLLPLLRTLVVQSKSWLPDEPFDLPRSIPEWILLDDAKDTLSM